MFRVTDSDLPAIEEALQTGDYDSVLGDREHAVGTYREFVVFSEDLVYPEYICIYERFYGAMETEWVWLREGRSSVTSDAKRTMKQAFSGVGRGSKTSQA